MTLYLTLCSAIAFLSYGTVCLFFNSLKEEFIRYKLSKFRRLVGFLEVLGATGQILGLYYTNLLLLSSFCFIMLMLAGIYVRLKVKDTIYQCMPALILLLINIFIIINL